jgi:hypothetical protein
MKCIHERIVLYSVKSPPFLLATAAYTIRSQTPATAPNIAPSFVSFFVLNGARLAAFHLLLAQLITTRFYARPQVANAPVTARWISTSATATMHPVLQIRSLLTWRLWTDVWPGRGSFATGGLGKLTSGPFRLVLC